MPDIRQLARALLAPVLLAFPPGASAQGTQLDGTWSGRTTCLMGPLSYAVTVEGRSGIVEYQFGAEPTKRFPVDIRTSEKRRGEWVYFEMPGLSARNDQAFGAIGGLLSPDARSMSVQGVRNCNEFQLVRTTAPATPTPETIGTPVRSPTEDDLRIAMKTLVGRIPGSSIRSLRKIGCEAVENGYFCEYAVSLQHSSPLGIFNLPEEVSSGVFARDEVSNRWIRISD